MLTHSSKWRKKAKRSTSTTWQDANIFFYQLEKINQLAFTIVQRKPDRNILKFFLFQSTSIDYIFFTFGEQKYLNRVTACHVVLSTISPNKIKDRTWTELEWFECLPIKPDPFKLPFWKQIIPKLTIFSLNFRSLRCFALLSCLVWKLSLTLNPRTTNSDFLLTRSTKYVKREVAKSSTKGCFDINCQILRTTRNRI